MVYFVKLVRSVSKRTA